MTEQTPDPHAPEEEGPRLVIIGPDGEQVQVEAPDDEEDSRLVSDLVEQPAKVMRIGSMIRQLLDDLLLIVTGLGEGGRGQGGWQQCHGQRHDDAPQPIAAAVHDERRV